MRQRGGIITKLSMMGLQCHNEDDGNFAYANGIDVRLMSSEGLSAHSFSNVPEFGGGVTRS